MHIVRRSSFTANPWRNGGGITHEAIRVPAAGKAFRWRVSVAQIDSSGPFSNFADYNRIMVLLRGGGLRLEFGQGEPVILRKVGDLAEFDGAMSTECELLAGPCTDLNVMVSKAMVRPRAWVRPLSTFYRLDGSQGSTTLVVGIRGVLVVQELGEDAASLEPWDLALIPPGDKAEVRCSADAAEHPLVFFAALDDNPS